MIRKLILTFILCAMGLPLLAQDNVNKMRVVMTDGSEIVYTLKEQPVISFSDTDFTVTVNGRVYNHPLASLQRYEIVAVNIAGVDNIDADRQEITRDGDIIAIEHAVPGSEISLYAVSGELIYATKADSHGNATLSLEHLASGIYILKVNETATKISKR